MSKALTQTDFTFRTKSCLSRKVRDVWYKGFIGNGATDKFQL